MNEQTKHQKKVLILAAQVADYYSHKKPFRIFHGSTNSTRILQFKQDQMIDTSTLTEVLSVDTVRQVAVVEPNVPMDKLVQATLRHGLMPLVVPEFPGITVGGAIQGGAGESSSFKYGFFSQTVNWVEYIVGDGTIITASAEKNSDLFYGAAGSCGSLGIITAVEIRLVPAKKYVTLTYQPVKSFEHAIKILESHSRQHDTIDFVDAIMYAPDFGVVIIGRLTDTIAANHTRFSRPHDPWFYLHVKAHGKQQYSETVPLADYLFRYDRGAFWVGRFAFELFGVPFTRFWRFALNPILKTRKLYQALQVSGASQEYIVQDLTLPLASTIKFLDYIDNKLSVYPLWLCPVLPAKESPLLCNALDTPIAINVGVWGPRIIDYDEFKACNRNIEKTLQSLKGKKWMYAHAYYTKQEFWSIYDKDWYDTLRLTYHADYLPSIYDKVVVRQKYHVNKRRGLLRTIFGVAKLRIEK